MFERCSYYTLYKLGVDVFNILTAVTNYNSNTKQLDIEDESCETNWIGLHEILQDFKKLVKLL